MPGAGEYPDRLEHKRRRVAGRDGFGQTVDVFDSRGFLWGAVENIQGNRAGTKEGERDRYTATVRLRNYPAVVAGDQLAGLTVWTVESVVSGDNETICEVTGPTWTVGGAEQ